MSVRPMRTLAALATATATAGACMMAVPNTATAAPTTAPSATGKKPLSVVHVPGDKAKAGSTDSAAASSCPIKVHGYAGKRVCGFDYFYYDWGGGNHEYFVVGTNYSVFHAWRGSGGWKPLGGKARKTAPNGAYATSPTGVATIGTDNRCWWRPRGNGSWPGSWRRC